MSESEAVHVTTWIMAAGAGITGFATFTFFVGHVIRILRNWIVSKLQAQVDAHAEIIYDERIGNGALNDRIIAAHPVGNAGEAGHSG